MARRWISLSIIIVMSGCTAPPATTANENAPTEQEASANAAGASGSNNIAENAASDDPSAIAPGQPGGLPDDRTAVSEGAIDPKSAQGAGQVMQRYGGLLEQRKFADARLLWSDNGRASNMTEKEFTETWSRYADIHSEVGKPGEPEGAAGSIYVSVPFRLYGKQANGKPFNMVGTVALRRVNDVPGSTMEQRQWHIASTDLKSTI
nr:hypothetical protein [uncultured Sphingomonas sp.]